jgi:hypothetical protein
MFDENLIVEDYIPEGCDHCGGDAMNACMGNKQKHTPFKFHKKQIYIQFIFRTMRFFY